METASRFEVAPGVFMWRAVVNGLAVRHLTRDPTLELRAEGVIDKRGVVGKLVDADGQTVAFAMRTHEQSLGQC